ncbi:hypothetical protein [Micromonospora sp. RTP1Z1]|uniref:hypothetical protein n=1 Tax=unclassified Micromonospora TaxID=2617518 RepID=UPI0029C95FC8|nr:hypothetical protein [Micromonospora sp. RTP1Z1]
MTDADNVGVLHPEPPGVVDPLGRQVSAMNATRAKYDLDDQELADVAVLLGRPVTRILAHW